MPSQVFEGTCRLPGLTSLVLHNLEAEQGQQLSLQGVSQLRELEVVEAGPATLPVLARLSGLQALSCLAFHTAAT